MSLGMSEILLILVVVLLLFGAKRLPEVARSLGRASSEFKRAKDGFLQEMEETVNTDADKTSAPEKEIAADAEASVPKAEAPENASAPGKDKEA